MYAPDELTLTATNFKCFANEPQGYSEIKPLNVIIRLWNRITRENEK